MVNLIASQLQNKECFPSALLNTASLTSVIPRLLINMWGGKGTLDKCSHMRHIFKCLIFRNVYVLRQMLERRWFAAQLVALGARVVTCPNSNRVFVGMPQARYKAFMSMSGGKEKELLARLKKIYCASLPSCTRHFSTTSKGHSM